MPTTLTDRFIKSIEPPAKGKRIYWDDHRDSPKGFGLRVLETGTMSFVLRYRAKSGVERIQTIGTYPTPWSLAAARLEAAKLRMRVDQGIDPMGQRRGERQEITVAQAVERFCTARVDGMLRGDEVRRYFERDLLPVLGKRQLRNVKRADIIALIEDKATKAPRAAALLLNHIRQLFAYAEDRELIEVSPAAGLQPKRISPALKPAKRGRVLDEAEIRDFWLGSETAGTVHRLTALALRLILITGQRPGEVAGMRWEEIEGDTWTIPASRRGKTKTAHTIYLTETAREILEQARAEVERLSERQRWEPTSFVFEHGRGKAANPAMLSRALDSFSDLFKSKDHPEWGRWHPHDLRRTCRTRLAEIGISEEVAERVIGHVKLGVVGIYNQHRYELEIRAALEAWERRLLAIIDPPTDNVVSFTKTA